MKKYNSRIKAAFLVIKKIKLLFLYSYILNIISPTSEQTFIKENVVHMHPSDIKTKVYANFEQKTQILLGLQCVKFAN